MNTVKSQFASKWRVAFLGLLVISIGLLLAYVVANDGKKKSKIEQPYGEFKRDLPFVDLSNRAEFGDDELEAFVAFAIANKWEIIELDLSQSGITDKGISSAARISDLLALNIGGTECTSDCLLPFENNQTLETLDASSTKVDSKVGIHISKIKSLTKLDLSSTKIGDEAVELLPANLTGLYLRNTQVSNHSIDFIKKMRNLAFLDIADTKIRLSDELGLTWIQELPNLAVLCLDRSQISKEMEKLFRDSFPTVSLRIDVGSLN